MEANSPSDHADPVGLSRFEEWEKEGADVRLALLRQKGELTEIREKIDRQLKTIERALSRIPEEPKTADELQEEAEAEAHMEWDRERFDEHESIEALKERLKGAPTTDVCRAVLKTFSTGLSAAAVLEKVHAVRPDIDKLNVYSFLSRSPYVKKVGDRGSLIYYPKGATK